MRQARQATGSHWWLSRAFPSGHSWSPKLGHTCLNLRESSPGGEQVQAEFSPYRAVPSACGAVPSTPAEPSPPRLRSPLHACRAVPYASTFAKKEDLESRLRQCPRAHYP